MNRVLAVMLATLTLAGLFARASAAAPAARAGAAAAARTVTVTVPAKGWTPTPVTVKAGEVLRITATGTWTDGTTTSGPNGAAAPWPDNFFNLADLGACAFCATTKVASWGGLIGYAGSTPPAAGSYVSTTVRSQALRLFYVGGDYEAEVLQTGQLWLAKNADAYSGYTVDNTGHVTAKITVLPPESASQVAARAKTAALAVSAATPLRQAWNYCGQAIWNGLSSQGIKKALKRLLPGANDLILGVTIAGYTVHVYYDGSDGNFAQAEFDFAKIVFKLLGEVPGFKLFGIVGVPAIDCAEAGFWLSGQLGTELGTYLRQKLLPKVDVTAGIQGTWKLNRRTLTCVRLKTCSVDPMILKFTHCTRTTCTLTRLNWTWKKSHPMVLKNGTWTAQFTDITANCGTRHNPARVTLKLTVTSHKGSRAVTLGGTYGAKITTNPPNCLSNASSLQDAYGGRA